MQSKYYFEPKNAVSNQKTSIKSLTNDNYVTAKWYQFKHVNPAFIVIA